MSANKVKLKKGDKVVVLTGKDKGKTGEVLKVIPADNRLVVAGVNIMKKHVKPSQTSQGGIETKEAAIHVSNVAYVDPKEDKPTRIGYQSLKDGKKVRVARRSGEVID